jgi:segregation and condensation protein B
MPNITQTIEAILFSTAEPQRIKSLAERLNVSIEEVQRAVIELQGMLEGHAMMLVSSAEEVHLAARPEHAEIIESMRKEELGKELTKASAETLAIVSYAPGISKTQIEFIRGVNVSYTLRSLQMRGLIEQQGAGRAVSYHPSLALLQSYGISDLTGLPHYAEIKAKIDALLAPQQEEL